MLPLVEKLLSDHRPGAALPQEEASASAVLVPLFAIGAELGVLFIRRSEVRGQHRGQMAFPGGMVEPADRGDLSLTALREAQEELGILAQDVRILGRLSDTRTVLTPMTVTPYVGAIPFPYHFTPDPLEVKSIHSARLADLAVSVQEGHNPFSLPPPVYPIDGLPVWGVSARILGELLRVLAPALR